MITVQNEPKAVQKWDSCVYTAEEERDFVKNYLGKKMKDIGVKILFWDHNKERIIDRAQITIDEQTKEFFDGDVAYPQMIQKLIFFAQELTPNDLAMLVELAARLNQK